MGVNCGHEQSMCSLDKRVSCPQAAQCVGLSGKKRCLYSPVGHQMLARSYIKPGKHCSIGYIYFTVTYRVQ